MQNIQYTTKIEIKDINILNEKQKILIKEFFSYFVNQNNYNIKKYFTLEDIYLYFQNMDLKNIDEIWAILLIPETYYKYKRKIDEENAEPKIKKERKNKPFFF